jgi:hypothetical protein
VSANERGSGSAIWVLARRVAAPLIALLLGAASTALLLDSGTVRLPSIGSSASSPPPEKIVVSPSRRAQPHHRSVAAARPAASRTSAPPAPSGPVTPAASARPQAAPRTRRAPKQAPTAAPSAPAPPITPTTPPARVTPAAPTGTALARSRLHLRGVARGHEHRGRGWPFGLHHGSRPHSRRRWPQFHHFQHAPDFARRAGSPWTGHAHGTGGHCRHGWGRGR